MKARFKSYNKNQKELQFYMTGSTDEIMAFDIKLARRKQFFSGIRTEIPGNNETEPYIFRLDRKDLIVDFLFVMMGFLSGNMAPADWLTFINAIEKHTEFDLSIFYAGTRNIQILPSDLIIEINSYLSLSEQSSFTKTNKLINRLTDRDYERVLQEHFPEALEKLKNTTLMREIAATKIRSMLEIANKWLNVTDRFQLKHLNKLSRQITLPAHDEIEIIPSVSNFSVEEKPVQQQALTNTDFKRTFHSAYQKNYKNFDAYDIKLITWFKAGALAEIKRARATLEDLKYYWKKSFMEYFHDGHRQKIMDYFYVECALPLHTDLNGKINVKKTHLYQMTLLHWAILLNQSISTLDFLVKQGANINARCMRGTTALSTASMQNNFEIVAFLISLPTIEINNQANFHQETALSHAVANNNMAIYEEIVTHSNPNDLKIYHALRIAIETDNLVFFQKLTLLPVFQHNMEVKILESQEVLSALHYVARLGRISMMEHLASLPGFNIDAVTDNSMTNEKSTAFMQAACAGQIPMMKYLMAHPGNRPNAKNYRHENAFFLAAKAGVLSSVKYMASLPNIEMSCVNSNGNNAMTIAVANGQEKIVRFLAKIPNLFDLNAVFLQVIKISGTNKKPLLGCLASLPGININFKNAMGKHLVAAAINVLKSSNNDVPLYFLPSMPNFYIKPKVLKLLTNTHYQKIMLTRLAAHSNFVSSYVIDKTHVSTQVKNVIIDAVENSLKESNTQHLSLPLIDYFKKLTSRVGYTFFRRDKPEFAYYLFANMLIERDRKHNCVSGIDFLLDHLNHHPAFRRFAMLELKQALQQSKELLVHRPPVVRINQVNP